MFNIGNFNKDNGLFFAIAESDKLTDEVINLYYKYNKEKTLQEILDDLNLTEKDFVNWDWEHLLRECQ